VKTPLLLAALLAGAIGTSDMAAAESKSALQSAAAAVVAEGHGPEAPLPALKDALGWINSPPLAAGDLRAKVVLVDFWTYSCINWMRTLAYLRTWADKYKSQGLVVVGVHTPEFEFEKDVDLVRRFTQKMNVNYPVAIDSNYAIWNAFDNQYWPALYVVDAQGRIRDHRFGEGGYDELEGVIRRLLVEAGAKDLGSESPVDGRGVEAAADWRNLKSPETYVGYARAENFASPGGAASDQRHDYAIPSRLRANQWALAGSWTVMGQFAASDGPGSKLAYRFHARDLHLVMGSAKASMPVRFRVRIDGHAPGADHGSDVDEQGIGTIAEPRLYQLVRQHKPIEDRQFEIEFLDPGAQVFSFTFG